MNITYVSASILPSSKANSVHVMKMCNAFSKNGHNVTLVGTKGNNIQKDVYKFYDVENRFQLKLARNNKFSSVNRLLYALRYSIKADIVYTRWIVAAMMLILFTNKKVIYEHHTPFTKGLNKKFESRIIKSKKIKRHVFITNALKEYYIKHYPEIKGKDTLVLADGADLKKEVNERQTKKDFDCIYIGSFQKGKGLDTVIKLANNLPEITFAIVGGSEKEVKDYRALTTNQNVKWYGFLPHEKTNLILKKAKIALLPNEPKVIIDNSEQDIGSWTSPMKLFEYMASRKAIVGSDLDVLKEVLENERNSLLVKYDDLTEWGKAIKKLLRNNQLLNQISTNAYNDLKENYTWKSRARKSIDGLKILP